MEIIEFISMDHNYTISIIICALSMIYLAIDVGKNTILKQNDIKWFKITFMLAAFGAVLEYLGALMDTIPGANRYLHWAITFTEFCISPYLSVCLARSSGERHNMGPILWFMGMNTVAQIISLFTGIIFYISADGRFVRGNLYWIYIFFCAISFIYIVVVFIRIGIRTKLRNVISIIIIASIVLVGQSANFIDGNIFTGYISICVTATLLYIFIQNMFRRMMIDTIITEKEISNHDPLTKVMSRLSFDDWAKKLDEIIQSDPSSLNFAICLCDLNYLKTVNDSFGHDTGDSYIINCCKTICNFFKHSPVFRVGGDEFVTIIQNEDFERLNQIKKEIHNFSTDEIKKKAELYEKRSFASGFATFNPEKDKSFNEVMKRADVEMYKNKKLLKSL